LNKNKIKNIFIKKMEINNNDDIHDIGYNSPKRIKAKNYLINKIHEKSSNINNEVLLIYIYLSNMEILFYKNKFILFLLFYI
jgi:hypothetical protein